jgi:hypothetical protein
MPNTPLLWPNSRMRVKEDKFPVLVGQNNVGEGTLHHIVRAEAVATGSCSNRRFF